MTILLPFKQHSVWPLHIQLLRPCCVVDASLSTILGYVIPCLGSCNPNTDCIGPLCRRHVSLLRSLVADVESSVVPYHTIVEVYRVAPHMPLMRVLPSAVDEVNAALFHPFKVSLRPILLSPLASIHGCQPLDC